MCLQLQSSKCSPADDRNGWLRNYLSLVIGPNVIGLVFQALEKIIIIRTPNLRVVHMYVASEHYHMLWNTSDVNNWINEYLL